MSNVIEMKTQAAPGARSIAEIISDLSKPVAPRHLKTRKQGGSEITYIEWHVATKYLDLYAPGWSFEVRSIAEIGDKCVVVARISIPCTEGLIHREATGQEDLKVTGWGDSSSNAEAMALKRAAAKFGLCAYLYSK